MKQHKAVELIKNISFITEFMLISLIRKIMTSQFDKIKSIIIIGSEQRISMIDWNNEIIIIQLLFVIRYVLKYKAIQTLSKQSQ